MRKTSLLWMTIAFSWKKIHCYEVMNAFLFWSSVAWCFLVVDFGFWNSRILVVTPKMQPLSSAFTKLCPLRLELFKLLPFAHACVHKAWVVKSQPIFSFYWQELHFTGCYCSFSPARNKTPLNGCSVDVVCDPQVLSIFQFLVKMSEQKHKCIWCFSGELSEGRLWDNDTRYRLCFLTLQYIIY